MNKMARFIKKLEGRRCPSCGKASLIPRAPFNYRALRCCNCGALGRLAS